VTSPDEAPKGAPVSKIIGPPNKAALPASVSIMERESI